MQPFPVTGFGGLDISQDPEEVGFAGAIDLLNVNFDRLGRLRSRYGLTAHNPVAAGVTSLKTAFYDPKTGFVLTSGYSVTPTVGLYAYDKADALQFSATPATDVGYANYVAIGTPTASAVYIASAERTVRKFNSAGFSVPAGVPAAALVTATLDDNRLVTASTAANPSRVNFSDPGVPETFAANNYVDLTPGDGQTLVGLCQWRNLVFVFKNSRFFVFYGTTTDDAGLPVFNYRTVDAGVGAYGVTGRSRTVVSGREGVYFYSGDAIYLSTGGPAQKISQKIEPFLLGLADTPFSDSTTGNGAGVSPDDSAALSYADGRLYATFSKTGATGFVGRPMVTFMYDPQSQSWTAYDQPFSMAADGLDNSGNRTVYVAKLDSYLYRHDQRALTDNGVAISARYQSGFGDLGQPGFEKTIRDTELTGTGTVQFGWARDLQAAPVLTSVVLGSSPSVYGNRAWQRVAQIGDTMSYRITGQGQWTVDRLVAWVRESRNTATVT